MVHLSSLSEFGFLKATILKLYIDIVNLTMGFCTPSFGPKVLDIRIEACLEKVTSFS